MRNDNCLIGLITYLCKISVSGRVAIVPADWFAGFIGLVLHICISFKFKLLCFWLSDFGQCSVNKLGVGSRVKPYHPTVVKNQGDVLSISAMPDYEAKSHEEIRSEDYQRDAAVALLACHSMQVLLLHMLEYAADATFVLLLSCSSVCSFCYGPCSTLACLLPYNNLGAAYTIFLMRVIALQGILL